MRMLIKDFAEFVGVSVRTLRYYDEIGLLVPANIDNYTGYRFYDEESLMRMQEIMFYRELDFSLKSIKGILDSPDYDRVEALKDQKELLLIKRERLDRIIMSIDDAMKGRAIMNNFNNDEYEKYKEEVKQKWGNTEAYKEYADKSKNYSKKKFDSINKGLDIIFKEFAVYSKMGADFKNKGTKLLVEKLQRYISANYYSCTKEILKGLGQMYVSDERFRKNIDKHGEGTAEYVSKAIEFYCKDRV